MEPRQRWFGENRQPSEESKKHDDPHYGGAERKYGDDRKERSRTTLLLVDSSPTILFYMGMLLKKLEYDVRTTTTAEDALKIMADDAPSLVITDTALPGMNGVNLLKQMRHDPRLQPIPVIFHTADADPAVRTACKAAGCAEFFIKPVEPEVLYRAIQAATETMPRQVIRIDAALPVEVGDGVLPGKAVRKETVTSLSEGGCFIKTPAPEQVNAVLALKMFIYGREIKAKATVLTRVLKSGGEQSVPGMAVKFLALSQEDLEVIRDFIKEHIMKDLSVP